MTPSGPSKPQPIIITPEPAEVFVGALVFHQYADEYLAAARAVPVKATHSPVPYFLYCRAIELALKCFLRAQRVPIKELKSRRLGHDLVRLHERAKHQRLSQVLILSSAQLATLIAANDYYAVKDFEYLPFFKATTGFRGLPNLDDVGDLAAAIASPMQRVGMDATDTKGPLFP
jgi:hypothetical protein